jgi:predicted nucleic acid-binding protein
VTLADTSAWVEYLRATGSDVHLRMRALLERDQLATTDVVLMEVLVGASDADHRDRLERLLLRCDFVATKGPHDYEDAAEIARACRRGGAAVRGLTDCLIASVAIRARLPVLHLDTDFERIARHTQLRLADVP